jgi:hypothetical protein
MCFKALQQKGTLWFAIFTAIACTVKMFKAMKEIQKENASPSLHNVQFWRKCFSKRPGWGQVVNIKREVSSKELNWQYILYLLVQLSEYLIHENKCKTDILVQQFLANHGFADSKT